MPTRYRTQPLAASTAYAQLHTAAMGIEFDRDVTHLNGSFGTKELRGKKHWYFSFRDVDQRVRQLYVGPDSPEVQSLIDKAASAQPRQQLRPLARSAASLGCLPTQRKHLTVIARLNEYGFFRAGGVLVGTHAFLSYANQLGLRWTNAEQTADVDFAHTGHNISIALPSTIHARPHSALTSMEEGFLPLVQFRGAAGASYRHRLEPEFQIDFLTPKMSDSDEPISVDNLDVALQPLRFMEFSLEGVQQATLFDPAGRAVVVTLPAPERYAIHKLLVAGERTGAFKAKVSKDVAQAASLIEFFRDTDPAAIHEAWHDAVKRGPGWRKRAVEGRAVLAKADSELAKVLAD
jgi:hypothetical protein